MTTNLTTTTDSDGARVAVADYDPEREERNIVVNANHEGLIVDVYDPVERDGPITTSSATWGELVDQMVADDAERHDLTAGPITYSQGRFNAMIGKVAALAGGTEMDERLVGLANEQITANSHKDGTHVTCRNTECPHHGTIWPGGSSTNPTYPHGRCHGCGHGRFLVPQECTHVEAYPDDEWGEFQFDLYIDGLITVVTFSSAHGDARGWTFTDPNQAHAFIDALTPPKEDS